MMRREPQVVEGTERYLSLYLETARKLTAVLDQENHLLLFEAGESQVLTDSVAQAAKQGLYARVETLARILTRTLQAGTDEDLATIQTSFAPVENLRRSLRLNTVLLEVCIERQERRIRRMMNIAETGNEEESNVVDRST